jgi:hypothetical protein
MRRYIFAIASSLLLTFVFFSQNAKGEPQPPKTTASTLLNVRPFLIEPTTTTTTLPIVDTKGALCPEWRAIAVAVGWPKAELKTLDDIIYRESRCNSLARADYRVAKCGCPYDDSFGLMQINVKGKRLWQNRRDVCYLKKPEDLLDGATNLNCGLALWQLSGWAPWGK